jgi:formate hydrogenlyase subunit 3/multisubunit Na+/H+ antiporter MnhD subunit
MNSMSFLFFGLMLIPLIIFLIYLIRQDKKKNYIGLVVLVIAVLIAAYVIITVDAKYMTPDATQIKQP